MKAAVERRNPSRKQYSRRAYKKVSRARLALPKPAARLDCEERNALIAGHRDDARRLAKSMLRSWKQFMEIDDLYSHVDAALCDAAASYRPELGARFFTHAYYFIKGNLAKALTARRRDADSLESLEGLSNQSIDKLLAVGDGRDKSAEELLVADMLRLRPDEALLRKQIRSLAAGLPDRLNATEREVILGFYYRGESISDVSRRLGYSRGHISRVHTRALSNLKQAVRASLDQQQQAAAE